MFLKIKLEKASSFIKPNSRVLDVGCYNGRLRKFLPKCEYFGVDIDKRLIKELKKQGVDAEEVDLNSGEIPFKKEKFHYIFLLDILEHIADPRKLLQSLKPRLISGGKLIITLPNDYHILNKFRFLFNKHLTSDPFNPVGHLHFFPIKTADKFIQNQGFKILKKEILAPIKPTFLSLTMKKRLASISPQSFARNILYLIEPL